MGKKQKPSSNRGGSNNNRPSKGNTVKNPPVSRRPIRQPGR